jgi:hypothetical protein
MEGSKIGGCVYFFRVVGFSRPGCICPGFFGTMYLCSKSKRQSLFIGSLKQKRIPRHWYRNIAAKLLALCSVSCYFVLALQYIYTSLRELVYQLDFVCCNNLSLYLKIKIKHMKSPVSVKMNSPQINTTPLAT